MGKLMNKSTIKDIFGDYHGKKLINWLQECCNDIGSFCKQVRDCLGISPQGDENKFLNQKGEWKNISSPQLIIEVTYSELLNLISSNSLVQDTNYLITDFKTVHYIQYSGSLGNEEIHVGNTEPMIVTAISSNKLSSTIISTIYPEDKITWKPLFDDRDYDAVLGQSTGIITSREDVNKKLYRDYDWRNVIFRRWETSLGTGDFTSYTDTGFGYQDFPPFNITSSISFDVSVGSGLEVGQIYLGLPYQLDNVVFQSDSSLSKVELGALSTFQDTFSLNTIGLLFNQLCQDGVTINNIKQFVNNELNGKIQDNILINLIDNNINGDFSKNSGITFIENDIDGKFTRNNFNYFEGNVVTGDITENLFMTGITNKTFTATAGMQANLPSVTLLDAVNGDVEQILSGGILSYTPF